MEAAGWVRVQPGSFAGRLDWTLDPDPLSVLCAGTLAWDGVWTLLPPDPVPRLTPMPTCTLCLEIARFSRAAEADSWSPWSQQL